MLSAEDQLLTSSERIFKRWMLICTWLFGLFGLHFLISGPHMGSWMNWFSEKLLHLDLYPLPVDRREGGFWLALGVSMMAMITWICWRVYRDPRANRNLVPVLLLSKFCSSAVYLTFFAREENLAYLLGFLSDAPLFVITWALWLIASPAGRYISRTEEEILVAVGDALMPSGGAFDPGFKDLREECLSDARRMYAAQSSAVVASLRLILKIVNLSPILTLYRPALFRHLGLEERQEALRRLERHRFYVLRLIMAGLKVDILILFFNQEEVEKAIGYTVEGA